jgi:predicted MFS family arabinose efflux permease
MAPDINNVPGRLNVSFKQLYMYRNTMLPIPLHAEITTAIKRIFKFDLFRHVKYAIYVTSVCLQMGNSVSNKGILPGQIRTLGLDKETIALSVSLIGASEIIGRVKIGLIADSNIISRMHIFMICSTICAVPAFCMPYLPYRNALLAYSMVIGGFSGSVWGLNF